MLKIRPEKKERRRRIVGWVAVAITIIITNLWTFWGIIENFHEGWYSPSILENLLMLFLQYLLLSVVFIALALVAIRWPKVGLGLHIVVGIFSVFFFRGSSFTVIWILIGIPLLLLGLLYFYGRPEPRKWAYRLIVLLPLIIVLCVTPVKIYQYAQRVNDGDFGMRTVAGNGVTLVWAPRGPGWPEGNVSYAEAVEQCKYLSKDGMTLMETEQNIWRLPTVEEAVSSMMLHNENAGGEWDPNTEKATYEQKPDKETPLWDPHSQVIYYWVTGDAKDGRAYIIVYDGGVYTRKPTSHYGYLTFRAVKDGE